LKNLFFVFCLCFFLLTCSFVPCFASDSWNEVIVVNGSGDDLIKTDLFSIDYVEWRIVWDFSYDTNNSDFKILIVDLVAQHEDGPFKSIVLDERNSTLGNEHIENVTGNFYMYVESENVDDYSIRIEQNYNSIPEFSCYLFLFSFSLVLVFFFIRKFRLKFKSGYK